MKNLVFCLALLFVSCAHSRFDRPPLSPSSYPTFSSRIMTGGPIDVQTSTSVFVLDEKKLNLEKKFEDVLKKFPLETRYHYYEHTLKNLSDRRVVVTVPSFSGEKGKTKTFGIPPFGSKIISFIALGPVEENRMMVETVLSHRKKFFFFGPRGHFAASGPQTFWMPKLSTPENLLFFKK